MGVFLMSSARQRDLPILLEDHHLHLLSIQLLHQSRTTTPTLGRLMLGATARTKTPTATRWRRSSSRTSVSLTRRKLAGHKTRRSAVQLCTRTVPVSLRLTLSELVCNLVEAVHYETLEETYQVQRCFTGKDRVC